MNDEQTLIMVKLWSVTLLECVSLRFKVARLMGMSQAQAEEDAVSIYDSITESTVGLGHLDFIGMREEALRLIRER